MSKHSNKLFNNFLNDDLLSNSDDNFSFVNNPFTENNYNVLHNRIKKNVKTLSGGKVNPSFAPYHYPKSKKQHLSAGSKVSRTDNVKAPNGTHWQNVTSPVNHYVLDYENSDIFSDFDGCFNLEKIGNKFHCWITLKDSHVIDVHGKPQHEITKYSKPIVDETWVDNDGSKSFALGSIAAYFAKHNIYEDTTQYPHAYHDVNMGCRAVKYWNIYGDGNNISKPHIIAHKGENLIIDTGKMKVYKTDGTDLSKYTSFESIFPPLIGGQINNINFYPTVGKDCDVQITYIPRIK